VADVRSDPTADSTIESFVISRTFDAPRDLVWKAFTDPERMKHWWGPKSFSVFHSKMDLRPGGSYHYGLRGPDGSTIWGKFVYREIVAPERMVVVTSFSDENAGITRHPMAPTWPREMLTTLLFEAANGKTKITIKWTPLNPTDEERQTFESMRNSMQQGWTGTFDKLAAYLPNA
jgi:uncharacterized protein YndB with AHSA1/START domain